MAISVSFALVMAFSAQAQNVVMGLKTPRLTTEERNTMPVSGNPYANGQVVYNKDNDCLEFWNGSKWRSFCEGAGWFYMPSIVIDVSTSGTFSRDLHLEYKKQVTDSDNTTVQPDSPIAGTAMVKSDPSAPDNFKNVYTDTELYYYVTGYDANVFSNLSITTAGVLTYTVNAANVSDATFMNIVLVAK